MRKRPEASPFICNLDLLIMLGGLLLSLPGLLALMPEGVAGLPIRWELELGRPSYRVYQEALQPATGRNSRRGGLAPCPRTKTYLCLGIDEAI